ncbi:MAG: zf-HC2 domain-containing protein [Clostridiales bacterium]|nr:zf-HC2 domain-containing protein [Clostridiales bacterium]
MKCEDALPKIDSYINNTMTCRELEEFLHHIKNCPDCYDELETYYIISAGTKYLEGETQEFYNIPQMLKEDLQIKERQVQRRHVLNSILGFIGCILGILAILFILFELGHIDLETLF